MGVRGGDDFAKGAVSLPNALGFVDLLSFGKLKAGS